MREAVSNYDLIATVTTDLTYDRRMNRICDSLAQHGWKILLVGRELPNSKPLTKQNYEQYRLRCRFHRGVLFYVEIIVRMSLFLRKSKARKILLADLDTIGVTLFRRRPHVKYIFDAHEWFTEVPELNHQPVKRWIWSLLGRWTVPYMEHALTVSEPIAFELSKKYRHPFTVIRNLPKSRQIDAQVQKSHDLSDVLKAVYLGVLNPGRGLEQIIEVCSALPWLELLVIGDGPLAPTLKASVGDNSRVTFLGMVAPDQLSSSLNECHVGLNLLSPDSRSYELSLANKFFDYAQAGLPSISMNFETYAKYDQQYNCAYLLESLTSGELRSLLLSIRDDPDRWKSKCEGARRMSRELTWESEAQRLIDLIQ
ncbi:MAG: glycosyltransferase [Bacteroidota bacterium]